MKMNSAGCILVITLALLISIQINPNVSGTTRNTIDTVSRSATSTVFSADSDLDKLEYDYYRHTCPDVEEIIRSAMAELAENHPNVAPALIRLAFHDCFVQGCDASILLDPVEGEFQSEKEAFPNANSLRGYDFIDFIKQRLEDACPSTVSCADIIVLSARQAVVMMGGPSFPLDTGRRDSTTSFASLAEDSLPAPLDDLQTMISTFKAKGFHATEMVSLLGAHTIGAAHCRFFESRLYDFNNTGRPDPNMDEQFGESLRTACLRSATSPSPAVVNYHNATSPGPAVTMDTITATQADLVVPMDNGSDLIFDGHYYKNVKAGKGLLYVDQALMGGELTRRAVHRYASHEAEFRKDFSSAMIKLFNLNVLTGRQGQVRKECSRVNRYVKNLRKSSNVKDRENATVP